MAWAEPGCGGAREEGGDAGGKRIGIRAAFCLSRLQHTCQCRLTAYLLTLSICAFAICICCRN